MVSWLLWVAVAGCGGVEVSDGPAAELYTLGEEVEPWHPSVLEAREIHWSGRRPEVGAMVSLPLFEGERTLRVDHRSAPVWSAGDGTLTVAEGAASVAATVREGGTLHQILPRDGKLVLLERHEGRIEGDLSVEPQPASDGASSDGSSSDGASSDGASSDGSSSFETPPSAGEGEPVIDVLVAYTGAAAAGAGGSEAVEAVAELALAETNQGTEDSRVPARFRLVGTLATSYDETDFDWQTTLSRLRGQDDGFMDELHAERDAAGADCVMLLVDTVGPYAGIGYQLREPFVPFFDAWAFSVVSRDYAAGAYTFAHELGHNMGAQHDPSTGGDGFFEDSHGHQAPEAGFRTLMAYPCQGCDRANRWSNDALSLKGAPTGVAGLSDNARTLAHTAPIVAGFRDPSTPIEPVEAAEMIAPPPGSTILGDTTAFRWTDVGADRYRLQVGASHGAGGIFDAVVEDTRVVVSGLPLGGEPLSVRLSTEDPAGAWLSRDYIYESGPVPDFAMSLAYPSDGDVLDDTALPLFWWSEGDGHHLQLGAPGDPTRYLDAPLDQSWTWVATPDDGSQLSVRLWSFGPDGVGYGEASLEAYEAGAAVGTLEAPAAGETTGESTTVSWSAPGAEEVWLVVREATNGAVLFSDDVTHDEEASLVALPAGRVIGTLHTRAGEGWEQTSAGWWVEP